MLQYMKRLKIEKDSPVPKVRQIEKQIREQIIAGNLHPGLKLPSMRDLAQQLGVSVGIAKQALNTLTTKGYLRSDPKVGVFVSKNRPTKDIALVLPTVELDQIARIVRSSRLNLPENYRLVIEAAANDFDAQIGLIEYTRNSRIEGILLMTPPMQQYAEKLNAVVTGEIPCVQILFELKGVYTDSSTVDGFEMGKMAAEYLIKKGHTAIGLVDTNADASTFQDRNRGIEQALKKIGKDYATLPKEIIRADKLSADDPSLFGKQATARLLEKHPELTAIIGGNGHIALGSIQAVKDAGKNIPDDISLISMGIDLSPFEHMTPAVTAIDAPLEKICHRAIQMLIDRINSPNQVFLSVQFPPILHERESVKTIEPEK
jgi:LacI family transcriptional regulator